MTRARFSFARGQVGDGAQEVARLHVAAELSGALASWTALESVSNAAQGG